jgi:hypothetical protein
MPRLGTSAGRPGPIQRPTVRDVPISEARVPDSIISFPIKHHVFRRLENRHELNVHDILGRHLAICWGWDLMDFGWRVLSASRKVG